jgi:hypothetical protein
MPSVVCVWLQFTVSFVVLLGRGISLPRGYAGLCSWGWICESYVVRGTHLFVLPIDAHQVWSRWWPFAHLKIKLFVFFILLLTYITCTKRFHYDISYMNIMKFDHIILLLLFLFSFSFHFPSSPSFALMTFFHTYILQMKENMQYLSL